MSNIEGEVSGIDSGLEVSLKEKELLMAAINDIPTQAKAYADAMDSIKKSIETNVWSGADGEALKEKFNGYLDQLILRQKELDKLSELAVSLKTAIEGAESTLASNIRSLGNE